MAEERWKKSGADDPEAMRSAPPTPTESDVHRLVLRALRQEPGAIQRFETGLAHFVFEALLPRSPHRVVVRMARTGRTTLADAVYWSTMLRPRGIPLPAILHEDLEGSVTGFPALILERFPGTDLGHVYADLTADAKRGIATEVARVQERVRALPAGGGFGFVARYDSAYPASSWGAVVHGSLDESEFHLRRLGWVDPGCVDPIRRQLAGIESYMDQIAPLPFLDDTTTKNVIIDRGRLSGIVDVDELCFGDRLFPLALTQMALLQADQDLDYIRFWCEHLQLTRAEEDALRIYTSVFCVTFLSEIGRRFNRSGPPVVDPDQVDRLQRILVELRTGG